MATPAILPVPTVADIAVINAWKGDIVPSVCLGESEGRVSSLNEENKFLHGNALVATVKYRPVHANNGIRQYSLQITLLNEFSEVDRVSWTCSRNWKV